MTYSTALAKHLSIVWLLLLLGCQYEPDGEFFKDIDDSRVSRPSIQLKDALGVIPLNEKTSFSYDIVTSRAHFRTEVFFDGKTIDYTDKDYGDGYFTLDPKDYREGQYSLRIVTAVGSGTGSLADKVDAEYIQSERTWEVVIERPEPVNIKTVSIDSGSIRLEWEAYRPLQLEKFSHYEISYDGVYGETIAIVTDPNVTVIYDSSFFSGQRSYQVNVRTENHVAYGEKFSYSFPHPPYEPNLEAELSNDTLKMRWDRPILYNNIKQFEVSFCCGQAGTSIYAEVNDTAFQAPIAMKFGREAPAVLSVRGHFKQHEQALFIGIPLEMDETYDGGDNVLFSPHTQSYYTFGQGGYNGNDSRLKKRYDIQLAEQSEYPSHESLSRRTHYQVSPNGKFLYGYNSSGVIRLDPISLKEIQSYDIKALFDTNYVGGISMTVSNNHLIAVKSFKGGAVLVDMESNLKLKKFTTTKSLKLSPDGEFLLAADTLYQRSGAGYVSVSILDGASLANTGFNRIHPHKLIIARSSTVKVYNCQTLSYASNVELPDKIDFFSIDPHTNMVGGYHLRGDKYYVVNLEDESVKSINIFSNSYYDYDQNYFLLNGNLFSKEGFYLKLIE